MLINDIHHCRSAGKMLKAFVEGKIAWTEAVVAVSESAVKYLFFCFKRYGNGEKGS